MSRPRNAESVFRAIADPTRRRMIDALHKDEHTVGDLMGVLKLGSTAATFHLGVLIGAGLVRQRRRGRHLVCVLEARPLHAAFEWLRAHAG